MDNALCGGAGATLTGAALNAVKAAIFMGDPHNVNGLSYNVGTCKAGGVRSRLFPIQVPANECYSLPPVLQALSALPPIPVSSSRTATPQTHTAAMATTPTRTNSTSTSTAHRPLPSSRVRLLLKSRVDLKSGGLCEIQTTLWDYSVYIMKQKATCICHSHYENN